MSVTSPGVVREGARERDEVRERGETVRRSLSPGGGEHLRDCMGRERERETRKCHPNG